MRVRKGLDRALALLDWKMAKSVARDILNGEKDADVPKCVEDKPFENKVAFWIRHKSWIHGLKDS